MVVTVSVTLGLAVVVQEITDHLCSWNGFSPAFLLSGKSDPAALFIDEAQKENWTEWTRRSLAKAERGEVPWCPFLLVAVKTVCAWCLTRIMLWALYHMYMLGAMQQTLVSFSIKTHLQIDSILGCLTLVVYMYLGNKEAFVGAQKSDSVGEIYPSAACACFWIWWFSSLSFLYFSWYLKPTHVHFALGNGVGMTLKK